MSQKTIKRKSSSEIQLKRRLDRIGTILVWLFLILLVLTPIIWLVQMSFRTRLAVFEMPPPLTTGWTFDNYIEISQSSFLRHMGNSLIVSTLTVIVSLGFGVPAAYAISRHRFRRETALAFWILTARLALPIGFALPLFNIFVRLGLVNTYFGIVLAYLTFTVPLVIWILRPFLDGIPIDMEEAAIVDGASNTQVFFQVVVPLAAPGLVSVGILTFILTWIEFFYALIFTRGDMMTAPVGVINFLRYEGYEWGLISTAGVLVMVPVILFALFTHRYLISGLTAGAVKG
jgi:multiple sugar transport system permease protein